MKLFDITKTINNKEYLSNVDELDDYNQYMINMVFGNTYDTVLLANELNKIGNPISNQMHYDFLYYATSKRYRYSKWYKRDKHILRDLISEHYNTSQKEAAVIEGLLDDNEKKELLNLEQGGIKNE